jgi:hypothetical protein
MKIMNNIIKRLFLVYIQMLPPLITSKGIFARKLLFCACVLFTFSSAWCQQSKSLFYTGSIKMKEKDSLEFSQCAKAQYIGADVKVLFFKKNILIDSLFTKANDYTTWHDTVSFTVNVPEILYNKSESVRIVPKHVVGCQVKGTRGTIEMNVPGDSKVDRRVKVKFKSNPAGSAVFLIPKFLWERNAALSARNEDALNKYRVVQGDTPVWCDVQEYVYISLFKRNNKYISLEYSANHKVAVDSVYANFTVR